MMEYRGGHWALFTAAALAGAGISLSGCEGCGVANKQSAPSAEQSSSGLTEENVKKIGPGMSEQEVASILGPCDREFNPLSGYKWQRWSKEGHEVTVFYDASGKVTGEPLSDFAE
jgi:hypothetical protein